MINRRFFLSFLATTLIGGLSAVPPVVAEEWNLDEDDPFIVLAQGRKKLTEAEAAKRAQRQHGGKVLGVTCREQDNRVYCSVRLDIDGRIKTVTVRG